LPIAAAYRNSTSPIVIAIADERREQSTLRELQLDESADLNVGCFHSVKIALNATAATATSAPSQSAHKESKEMEFFETDESEEDEPKALEFKRKYRLKPGLDDFESEPIRKFLDKFLAGKLVLFLNSLFLNEFIQKSGYYFK